jgi:hypothetical protein
MNTDQSQALVELARNVKNVNTLITNQVLTKDKIMEAWTTILEIRANANLVKSYVLERMEQEEIAS